MTCEHLFGPCCAAGSSFLAAMFLQMEEIRRMADPWGLVPPAKVKHCLLPPPPAHFPPLPRGPWVTHTSPSLHSKPWRSGYKLSLLMLPCSTDTAWNGMKILSQPYLAHLYIQNMCLGSFLLPSIYSSLKAQHLPGKREGKNRSAHFFISFFFFFFFFFAYLLKDSFFTDYLDPIFFLMIYSFILF